MKEKMSVMYLLRSFLLIIIGVSTTAFVMNPISHGKILFSADLLLRHFTSKIPDVDKDFYRPSKVDGENYDAIVIGSGIGGLTTASLIAQAGKKVLVLEQHYVAGGTCHTFKKKGYEFATGIHYVGNVGETSNGGNPSMFRRLVDSVTPPDSPVEWDRMDDNFDTVLIGTPPKKYHFVAGEKRLKNELIKQFPEEEKAINRYFKIVKKITSGFGNAILLKAMPLPLSRFLVWTGLQRMVAKQYTKATKLTLMNLLQKLTKNKDLQALLAYNYICYGTEPSKAPFLLQALTVSHYMDGAYYPRGGPSSIPTKIIQSIISKGGKVLVSAPVEHVLVDKRTGKVKGVQMQDGIMIACDIVVSDAGLLNTVTNLLPEDIINIEFAAEDNPTLLHPGTSGLALFVGLEGTAESLNLPRSNVFIHSSNDLSATNERIKRLSLDDALELDPKDFGAIFVSCPSTKDSSWAVRHPKKSTLEIFTQFPYHWFEKFERNFDKSIKSHGPEYEFAKTRLAEKMWTRVVQALPTAKLPKTLSLVDHYEVGSPISFNHYYKSHRGALFGLDHDLKRFEPKTFFLRLRPELPEVPGLYLTGQDVVADGMIGAMMGGLLCAQKVLRVTNPISLLRNNKEEKRSK